MSGTASPQSGLIQDPVENYNLKASVSSFMHMNEHASAHSFQQGLCVALIHHEKEIKKREEEAQEEKEEKRERKLSNETNDSTRESLQVAGGLDAADIEMSLIQNASESLAIVREMEDKL